MTLAQANLFAGLPGTLRGELLEEYRHLVTDFYEGRWGPSELSAGRFCEVVYSIIRGRADGAYPSHGSKPTPFDAKCRALENETSLERGLRLLAARILPALYEIRNNRDSGHVGGEVNSNEMDATYAVAASGWILAELIRVFHDTTTEEAQIAVKQVSELRTPVIWSNGTVRRVLKDGLKLEEEVLLLIASAGVCSVTQLIAWTETSNPTYLRKVMSKLHDKRLIEASDPERVIATPKAASLIRNLLER